MYALIGPIFTGAFFALLGALCVRMIPWYIAIPCAICCALIVLFCAEREAPIGHEDKDGFHSS